MKKVPCPKCRGTGKLPDQKALGFQMRKLREASGLSLRDVGHVLDFSAAYLSDLERGRRDWPQEIIALYRSLKENAK